MRRKILALDLDGTLTNSKKEITPRTREAISKMQEQGHQIVLASGRPTPGVTSVAKILELDRKGGYMLSYNGAKITDCRTGEILYQKTMPPEIVPEIFSLAKEMGIGMMTYQPDGIIAGEHRDEYMELEARINGLEIRQYKDPASQLTVPVNKCLGTAPAEVAAQKEKVFEECFGDRMDVDRSEPFFIELTPKGVNKAASLEAFCQIVGANREDLIACGDGFNDRTMIEYAGLGIAMANAQDSVKELADYITASNDEDGVAQVIEKFILQ